MVKVHIDVQMQFVELMGEYARRQVRQPHGAAARRAQGISEAAEKIRAELEAAKTAQFNALIKAALDCVDNAVGVADKTGQYGLFESGVYEAPAQERGRHTPEDPRFRRRKGGWRQRRPVIRRSKRDGRSLASLSRSPTSCSRPWRANFHVVDSPVFDENGERLGVTGRWTDVTEQLAAEKEVAALVEAAAAGDFSQRLAEGDKSGFMLQMAQGLNQILGTSEQALGEIGRILKALADGDLCQNIETNFKGVFAELKVNSNEHHRTLAWHHRSNPRGERIHQYRGAGDCDRQQRPVAPHRRAGDEP